MILTLHGHCPAKKNNWKPRAGGIRTDTAVANQIEALRCQAWIQWKKADGVPLEHPELRVTFHVRDQRGDRDNKLSTILDVLQKADVLRNDNMAHCNGVITILPAVLAAKEKTVIEITEASATFRETMRALDVIGAK